MCGSWFVFELLQVKALWKSVWNAQVFIIISRLLRHETQELKRLQNKEVFSDLSKLKLVEKIASK